MFIAEKLHEKDPELSTPHGALGTPVLGQNSFIPMLLSTPHGALGTPNHHIN